MSEEYFCGSCYCYRQHVRCEKCGKPTVTVGYTAPGKKESPKELYERWKKLYSRR